MKFGFLGRTCMVLIHTAQKVKVPYHWSRQQAFLDCLVHFLQIHVRTTMDSWKQKISSLMGLFKCLNRFPTPRQYGQDLRAPCLERWKTLENAKYVAKNWSNTTFTVTGAAAYELITGNSVDWIISFVTSSKYGFKDFGSFPFSPHGMNPTKSTGPKSRRSSNGKFIHVRMIGQIDFWLGICLFGLTPSVNNDSGMV